jgi:hypothetical protein
MQGILSSRTIAAAVLLLGAGFLLTRHLGRRMGESRRSTLGEVNRVLAELATVMQGRFEQGPKLSDHPLLGEVRQYGVARLSRGPLAVEVGVSYPADDLRDDHSTVRVRRPPDRAWRISNLHERRRPTPVVEPARVDAELTRCFKIEGVDALPEGTRQALLQVGAHAFALDLNGDTLELTAVPDGDTVYIADVARLRALVEEVERLAEELLAPPAA